MAFSIHVAHRRRYLTLSLFGWSLFISSIPIWLAAFLWHVNSLKAVALGAYLVGGCMILVGLPRRHRSLLHGGLVAIAIAQIVTLPFVVSRPGRAPIVLDFYGWAWFFYSCLHTALTLLFLLLASFALGFIDSDYLEHKGRALSRLLWSLSGLLVAGLGLVAVGFSALRFAPENAFGLIWPLSVLPACLIILLAIWLHQSANAGWLLVLYSILFWILALEYQLGSWSRAAVVYYIVGLGLVWWPRARVPVSVGERDLGYFSVFLALLLPLSAFIQSENPDILHSYSSGQVAILAIQVICVLPLTFIAYYRPKWVERAVLVRVRFVADRLYTILVVLAVFSAAMILGMAFFSLISVEDVPFSLISVTFPMLATAVVVGHRIVANPTRTLFDWRAGLVAAVGVVSLVSILLSIASLKSFPNFSNTDEPWTVNFNDTFDQTGYLYASMVPTGEIPSLSAPRIYLVSNIWMNLWDRNIFAARSFSLIGGLALLAVVFAMARELQDIQAGLIAVFLTLTNLLWLAVSHVARPEMWFSVAIWLAFLLSLIARRRESVWLAALSGIVIVLSADIHSAGPLICVLLGIWWLSDWKRVWPERRILAGFIIGGVLGTVFYVGYHVLPDPAAYWHAIQGQVSGQGGGQLTPLQAMIERHKSYYQANRIEFVGLIVGSLAAMVRLPRVRRTGLFATLLIVAYALLQSDPNIYYPMIWFTGIIILAACAVRLVRWQWQIPIVVIILSSFGLNALLIRAHMIEDWNGQELTAIHQVVERIPEHGIVLANPLFYFALRDPRLVSYPYVETLEPDRKKQWPVIESVNPRYIIGGPIRLVHVPMAHTISPFPYMDMPTDAWALYLTSEYAIKDAIRTHIGTFVIWQRRDVPS